MSKFDVSDFDADQLNQEIDDTNFPNSRSASFSAPSNGEENGEARNKSQPLAVKPNGFAKSFDDEVFDVPGTPRTPRSLPTSGNCECNPPFSLFWGSLGTQNTQQPQKQWLTKTSESSTDHEVSLLNSDAGSKRYQRNLITNLPHDDFRRDEHRQGFTFVTPVSWLSVFIFARRWDVER